LLYYVAGLPAFLRKLLRSDEGATAVEYGLMVVAIFAVVAALVFTLGDYVWGAFDGANTELEPHFTP
jgi:pilus assembly protein Flp/PilA